MRSKKQTRKKTKITKQKQNFNQQFSRTRNAVSESDSITIRELQNLRDLVINKSN